MKFTENQKTLDCSSTSKVTRMNAIKTSLKTMIHRAYALSFTTEAFNAERAKLRSILSRLDYLSNEFY